MFLVYPLLLNNRLWGVNMLDAFDSYLYGLILTDGSIYLTGNKGKVTIELKASDRELLEKIQERVPTASLRERVRDTNFKQNSHFVIFSESNLRFRQKFIQYGIPLKNKSLTGTVPNQPYVERDFWRGVIDGNGSVGFTSVNEPFVSLVIKSEALKEAYCALLKNQFGVVRNVRPNKRDHVYIFTVKNEDAIALGDFLYADADIYLKRKFEAYLKFKTWVRTKKKLNHQSWSGEELQFIKTHTIEESMFKLDRSEQSIKMKLWRLSKN